MSPRDVSKRTLITPLSVPFVKEVMCWRYSSFSRRLQNSILRAYSKFEAMSTNTLQYFRRIA